MKIKFILFTLIVATFNFIFPQHVISQIPKPFRCTPPFKNKCDKNRLEADVIVIGSGAGGAVVMNQLSEGGCFSVLGLEAGANLTNDPAIQAIGLPALLLPATNAYKYFWWGWKQTEPDATLNGRIGSDWITGLILGGGTSVNGLYYGRGSNSVYSQWETVSGSDNWSLDKILAAFNQLENYQGLQVAPGSRGKNGPVSVVQTPGPLAPMTATVLMQACQNAFPFLPTVIDYNDPTVENCIDPRTQWLIDPTQTKRVSSATAFLNSEVMTSEGEGVNGHDLRVLFESVAVKIVFNKHGRAKKVLFVKDGQLLEAHARKAVVLAGGINSSKLLQLSGIGPEQTLSNAGIKPVYVNENVGQHLQNHPLITIALQADPALSGIPPEAPYAFTIQNVYLPAVGGGPNDPRMLQILFEYIPAGLQSTNPVLAIGFELLNPKSEGSVNIQSDNSFQIPAVNDGFYQDPADLANMVSAIQNYIQALLLQLPYPPVPGDPIIPVIASGFATPVVELYVRSVTNLIGDGRHFASHCKMAPLESGGVVDGETRVYGTTNCFVTDCSICPVIPNINTTGPAMMIGWRSSEILKRLLRKK